MSADSGGSFLLTGKRILVTGGTRGIGRAVSIRFARAGAVVVANYLRNEKAAAELHASATNEGLEIMLCRADLTTDRGLEQIERAVEAQRPVLSGLVYCAATGVHRPVAELTESHFDWTMNLNVRAFFRLSKRLMGRFAHGASIVAVSSWGALRALPDYALVGASKAALESLARHMAVELAPRGIRVNALTAGAVLTDAWKAIPDREARIAEAVRRTPGGQLVSLEQVACAAQFLCSDASAGIVGHTLVVDAGAGIVG